MGWLGDPHIYNIVGSGGLIRLLILISVRVVLDEYTRCDLLFGSAEPMLNLPHFMSAFHPHHDTCLLGCMHEHLRLDKATTLTWIFAKFVFVYHNAAEISLDHPSSIPGPRRYRVCDVPYRYILAHDRSPHFCSALAGRVATFSSNSFSALAQTGEFCRSLRVSNEGRRSATFFRLAHAKD